MCIEFGPVRVDSVRRGGGAPPPGSNPPCAGSRRRGLLPGLLVIACYLSFTPSSLKSNWSSQKSPAKSLPMIHISCKIPRTSLSQVQGDGSPVGLIYFVLDVARSTAVSTKPSIRLIIQV